MYYVPPDKQLFEMDADENMTPHRQLRPAWTPPNELNEPIVNHSHQGKPIPDPELWFTPVSRTKICRLITFELRA